MPYLKQSTTITIQLGPFVDSTDGVTAEVALSPTVELSKGGAVFAARNSATAIAHDQQGWYRVELNTTDTNTLGSLLVKSDETGALPVWREFEVLPAAVFDTIVSGTGNGIRADLIAMGGVLQSATDLKHFADSGYDPATTKVQGVVLVDAATIVNGLAANVITAASIAADAITDAKVATDVTIASVTGAVGSVAGAVGSVTGNVGGLAAAAMTDVRTAVGLASANIDAQLGAIAGFVDTEVALVLTRLGTPAGISVSADVAAVKVDTAATRTKVDTLHDTRIPGVIQPQTGDSFARLGAPIAASISADIVNVRGADNDSLKTISDQIDGLATAAAPQLLQNTTIATLTTQADFTLTAGSADDNAYNGAIAIIRDSVTTVQKAVATILDYTGATRRVQLTADPAIFTMAVGDTVDILAAIGSAPTAAAIRAEIDANSTKLIDIVADTNELQTDWVNGGRLDNILDARASSTEVIAIQNNTRVVRTVPTVIERPDIGTTTYRVELFLYDEVGNMEVPDSAPTVTLVNQTGTDLSARLDSVTMALVSTGRYRVTYTATNTDTLEQLVWAFSVVEGGLTRLYGNTTIIVDTTAVDFTSADRTKLDTLHDTRIPGVIQPQTGDSFARIGALGSGLTAADDATLAAIAALNNISTVQVKTQVVDALSVDTYAEPGQGTPGVTVALSAKIGHMYKMFRNRKTQTATQISLYADDATTIDAKAAVADDGTTTSVAELVTGP